jgi:hypothetical protein
MIFGVQSVAKICFYDKEKKGNFGGVVGIQIARQWPKIIMEKLYLRRICQT